MRSPLLLILLFLSGCGMPLVSAPETADEKAIRAFLRESAGDSEDIGRVRIVETGKCSQYEVNLFNDSRAGFAPRWTPNLSNKCAVATVGNGKRRIYEFDDNGKAVVSSYSLYKRK